MAGCLHVEFSALVTGNFSRRSNIIMLQLMFSVAWRSVSLISSLDRCWASYFSGLLSKMASLWGVWRKHYMSRLLSCYWFSKNTCIRSKCLFFRKLGSSLDLLSILTADLAGSGEGCRGAGHTSLEFLGLHNNGFVCGCFCKSLLQTEF